MKTCANYLVAYGILMILGGGIGYWQAGSSASLVMGGVIGAVSLLCALGVKRERVTALFVALANAGVTTLFFLYRFKVTGKAMPALLMAALSALVVVKIYKTVSSFYQTKSQVS